MDTDVSAMKYKIGLKKNLGNPAVWNILASAGVEMRCNSREVALFVESLRQLLVGLHYLHLPAFNYFFKVGLNS